MSKTCAGVLTHGQLPHAKVENPRSQNYEVKSLVCGNLFSLKVSSVQIAPGILGRDISI